MTKTYRFRVYPTDEQKAAFSLAIGRGNYADFTAFIERSVEASYREAGNV